jgi:hypothetical protein
LVIIDLKPAGDAGPAAPVKPGGVVISPAADAKNAGGGGCC